METFSLLKYWRNGTGVANLRSAPKRDASANVRTTTITTTTIATSALRSSTESDEDEDGEGSFFDLEFAVQNDGDTSESCDEEEQTEEVNFTVSSSSSSSDPSFSLSPTADDLFFKGELLPLEPSIVIATSDLESSKPSQLSNSLIKSATKFRVFMLNLKKPNNKSPQSPGSSNKTQPQINNNKFFIKFKVEEVPIVSLFTRESSSKKASKMSKSSVAAEPTTISVASAEEMKKFSKETVQKYINKIKPLYVRVSKRYGEKLRFSGMLTDADGAAAAEAHVEKVKVPPAAGLRVVRKRLGKSKSAPPATAASAASSMPSPAIQQRRDDSLLQQQDGIQSAIAHCKRSFAVAAGSQSPLVRSKSDPSCDVRSEKAINEGDQS